MKKKNKQIGAFVQGIEALLSRNRDSLTVEEVEMLESLKTTLQHFENSDVPPDQILVLKLVLEVTRFYLHADVADNLKEFVDYIKNLF